MTAIDSTSTRRSELPEFLRPFHHRLFFSLWTANAVSNLGTWMQTVGASWLMVSLNPSPLMVSLVQTAATLPMFFFAIPASTVADRMDRPKFLAIVQTFMALSAGALGVITLTGKVSVTSLLLFTFLLATGSAMNLPAWQSAVSGLMKHEDIRAASSLNNLSFNFSRAVGPALGGVLIGAFGVSSVFLLNALSFVALIGVFVRWMKTPHEKITATESFREGILTGFRHVRQTKGFNRFLVYCSSAFFFGSALWALLPTLISSHFGAGAVLFGILMGALGVGAVLAAVTLPRLRKRFSREELVAGSLLLYGVACALMVVQNNVVLTFALLGLAGTAWAALVSEQNAFAQASFPLAVRSRALAIYFVAFYGAMALGSFAWGVLAERFGIGPAICASSAGMLMTSLCPFVLKAAKGGNRRRTS